VSPFDPRTAATARIAELGWFMIAAATVICVVVFAALFLALLAGRRRRAAPATDEAGGSGIIVIAGMVLPGLVIAGTLAYTVLVLRDVAGAAGAGGLHAAHDARAAADASSIAALPVALIAHQWWWEVTYPTELVTTANEIHVPAGAPVTLSVTSQDVIHSFWVPQVAGKVDVLPGQVNAITFRVDQPGVYRGQCAEFCGIQHAHMHLYLFVDSPADYAAWLAAQQRVPPPPPPTDSLVTQGQRLVLTTGCAQCHTVRGTSASGMRGPDLTHVSSRRTLGAGAHENTPANLARWVSQPQAMKPGNKMPDPALSESEARAIAAYLESLE
jgi:cytochrome c oxidase subunit 2